MAPSKDKIKINGRSLTDFIMRAVDRTFILLRKKRNEEFLFSNPYNYHRDCDKFKEKLHFVIKKALLEESIKFND